MSGVLPNALWTNFKPSYDHIKDPWVKQVFEEIDRAVFEAGILVTKFKGMYGWD